jgi:hypothetical protein
MEVPLTRMCARSAIVSGLALSLTLACGGKSGQPSAEPSEPTSYEVIGVGSGVVDIAIDSNAVFWTDQKQSAIFRRGLNKSDIAERVTTDVIGMAMASDDANVYWVAYTDKNLDSLRLRAASKDGQRISTLVPGALDSTILPAKPIAAGGGYVYWQKYSQPTAVLRVASTGGEVEEFAGPSSTAKIVDTSLHGYPPQPLFADNKIFEFLEDAIRVYDLSALTATTFFSGIMHAENACFVANTLYIVGWPDNNSEKTGVWAIRDGIQTLVTSSDISARVACSSSTAYIGRFELSKGVGPMGPVQIYEIDVTSLTPRLMLQLASTEKGFYSNLAYGGNALALVSNSGLIRIPLDPSK